MLTSGLSHRQGSACTQNTSCSHFFTEPDMHSVPTNMCKNAHEATLLMLAGKNSRLFVTAPYHTLTFCLGKINCEVIMNIYMCFLMNTLRLQWLQLDLHTVVVHMPFKANSTKTSDNLEVLKKLPKLTEATADITVTIFDLVRKA